MDKNLRKDILGAIAVIVIICIFLGITALIMHVKERYLRKEGIISKGIITYCADKQTIHIAYYFTASNGIGYNGKRGVNKKYNIGDTVYVIYLEDNPAKHKMIDKYSEYDQKLLRDVQVRLGNYSYDKDTYVPFVSGYPDTIVALRLMYGKNKIKQLEYE